MVLFLAGLIESKGAIDFKGVEFSYIPGKPVLDGISFSIRPGGFVAIAGVSGSGKSTLLNLIPCFYGSSAGAIEMDQQNIKDITLTSLRKQTGYVWQENYLFDGTIRENLSYGQPDAAEAEITAAAR